ncbi:MAG: hypothetical protein K8I30_11145 [Anaerolineae bacterium]|nr:hypothetical protein [Anaerolineae bacterium]
MEQRSETLAPTPVSEAGAKKQSKWTVQRIVTIAAGVLGGIILLLFVIGLLLALFSDVQATAPRIQIIRDILAIVIALEFILIVGAFAILVLQVARLALLLRNEVKPVLENTQDAVNTAKGTVEFVGNNVTEPVVRVGAFLAGANVFVREVGGIRRAIRRNGKEKEIEPTE